MARKLGLLHGPRRIEVQDVKPSHKKVCSACGQLPEGRRLVVTDGAGRSASSQVFCIECGEAYLQARALEYQRAIEFLNGDRADSIRVLS